MEVDAIYRDGEGKGKGKGGGKVGKGAKGKSTDKGAKGAGGKDKSKGIPEKQQTAEKFEDFCGRRGMWSHKHKDCCFTVNALDSQPAFASDPAAPRPPGGNGASTLADYHEGRIYTASSPTAVPRSMSASWPTFRVHWWSQRRRYDFERPMGPSSSRARRRL